MDAGANSAQTRAISEPIDPPAPVMSTRRPPITRATCSRLIGEA
jgi:hypothetical protein